MNLVLLEREDVDAGGGVLLRGDRAAHLLNVLHVAPGHAVRIGLVDGARGEGTVDAVGDGVVALRCRFEADTPARPAIDLMLAVPRPKVMRRLWAQIAALGVGQIILTNAEKVERNYFDTHILEPETYRPLLLEGLQQARDTRLPAVSIHRQFKVLVEDRLDALFRGGRRVVADPAAPVALTEAARRQDGERLLLAIGPEGGWNAFELDLLRAHRFQAATIGPRTLRTDTACIALLAIAHAQRV